MSFVIITEDEGQLRAFHAAVLRPEEQAALQAIVDRHVLRIRSLKRASEVVDVVAQQVNGHAVGGLVHDEDTGKTRVSAQSYQGGLGYADSSLMTQGEIARTAGFSGNVCQECFSFEMVRSGTCETCKNCGKTSGGCS